MTQKQLNEALKQHKVWLDTKGEEGKRADLRGADLMYFNLRGVDLSYSSLTGADVREAHLIDIKLIGADLRGADLRGTNLRNSDLRNADLGYADLSHVGLEGTNLEGTGIRSFKGPCHRAIYNSKDDKLYIGCQVHNLEYWLENYVDIGRKYEYTDEEIEVYGKWFKSLNGDVK